MPLVGPYDTEAEALAVCNSSDSSHGSSGSSTSSTDGDCSYTGDLYCSISPSCGIPPGPMFSAGGDTSWSWGATVSCGDPLAGWQATLSCTGGVYTLTTTDGENTTVSPSTSPFYLSHTWTPPAGQCCGGTEVTLVVTE
jgi:hypothetical protein